MKFYFECKLCGHRSYGQSSADAMREHRRHRAERHGKGKALGVVVALAVALSVQVYSAGHLPEDSDSFDCRSDGNRICGPGNSQGVPAGCYSDAGALVSAWPCRIVVNADGSADVYN